MVTEAEASTAPWSIVTTPGGGAPIRDGVGHRHIAGSVSAPKLADSALNISDSAKFGRPPHTWSAKPKSSTVWLEEEIVARQRDRTRQFDREVGDAVAIDVAMHHRMQRVGEEALKRVLSEIDSPHLLDYQLKKHNRLPLEPWSDD